MLTIDQISQDIMSRAKTAGVDPYFALGLASREGLNPNTIGSPTFGNRDAKGYSYGPWQLYSGSPEAGAVAPGGLAAEFMRQYGAKPSADNWQQQNQFAIDMIKKLGPQGAGKTWYAVGDNGGPEAITKIGHQFAGRLGASAPTVDEANQPPMAFAMNGGKGPQDAGGSAIQNAFGAPGGAQSQSPLQSVLIGGQTSGDSGWDRLDNIGNGLQRAGAAIMAISNPSGAASLASMANQNAKNRWTYAGTTPNGMGMIMRGPNGETRIDPIPAGYAGESQANLPSNVREFQYAQSNPQYKEWLKEREGITNPQDPAPDPDSLKMFGMDYLVNGNQAALKDVPQKQRSEALRLAKEQFKADTGQDYDPADLALRRGAYQELISESRKFGQMLGPTQTAHDRLMADIKIAKERIADLPAELNSSNLPWNKFRQMTAEQLQDAGFGKLAQAREAIYNVERGYSAVQANGMRSGDTVAAQKRAEGLINSAMSPDVLLGQVGKDGQRSGGLLDFMGDSANRILDNVKGGQKRLREEWKRGAQEFGSRLSQEEEKITRDIESKAAPQAPAPQQQQGQPQGGPVRVNSIEEAQKLAPGTQFLTPDGRLKIR